MNARGNLLDNFSNMKAEFDSSNNRIIRDVYSIFTNEFNDFSRGMKFFSDEYSDMDVDTLKEQIGILTKNVNDIKVGHVNKHIEMFNKELVVLEREMYNFFCAKLDKGDNCKKKLSAEIKHTFDKMCDVKIMELEENIRKAVYNFKIGFENDYISDEYSKDDFNKLVRSFEHSLVEHLRDKLIESIKEKQNIVSRYALNAYEIINRYHEKQR